MKLRKLLYWYHMFRSYGNSRKGSFAKAILLEDKQRVFIHPVGEAYKLID